MINLSERLQKVASFIPIGSVLADIGSDHAYLPIYTMQNNITKMAIAGEVAEGPFQAAKASVMANELSDLIEVRKGDGLAVIHKEDLVDCITICGMGGPLIASILDKGKDKIRANTRLVLQPNIASHAVRKWLIDEKWELITETILEEDGHIYEILVAERGNPLKPYHNAEKEIYFGPFLLKEKSEVFRKKWAHERKEWERIYKQLENVEERDAIKQKKEQLMKYMTWYEEERL